MFRPVLQMLCVASALALLPEGADAHSKQETTAPADGAVLEVAPEVISLTFDMPMRITLVRLSNETGQEFDVSRSDGMEPVTEFEATPAALSPGAYTVEWRGLSEDGHPMEGRFSFRIAD